MGIFKKKGDDIFDRIPKKEIKRHRSFSLEDKGMGCSYHDKDNYDYPFIRGGVDMPASRVTQYSAPFSGKPEQIKNKK